jgi:lysophospholipase L1-like esterase
MNGSSSRSLSKAKEAHVVIYRGVELHNVEELLEPESGTGRILARVPQRVRDELNEKAYARALNGAGVEIRFNMEEEEVSLWLRTEAGEGVIEVWQGAFQLSSDYTPQVIGTTPKRITVRRNKKHEALLGELYQTEHWPFDPELVRILLPRKCAVRLMQVEGAVSAPRPEQLPKKRMLFYGSSITSGADSAIPSASFAARTADQLGFDAINLGFSGSCYVEEAMADYIVERTDWDIAVLELGINVIELYSPEQFESKVDYMLRKVHTAHPSKPVFCIDLFTTHRDYNEQLTAGAETFRGIVQRKVEELGGVSVGMDRAEAVASGAAGYEGDGGFGAAGRDRGLFHIPGRRLLPDLMGLSADLLHPSPYGMATIANNLADVIQGVLRKH